ncbi:MAG TPA: hypothetical protein VGE32_16835, partial [Cellvibrio sp.]
RKPPIVAIKLIKMTNDMFAWVVLEVSFMVIPIIEIIFICQPCGQLCYCRWFDGATISQLPGCGQLPIGAGGLETSKTPVS